jgi:hypothetical protein
MIAGALQMHQMPRVSAVDEDFVAVRGWSKWWAEASAGEASAESVETSSESGDSEPGCRADWQADHQIW